MTDEKDDYYLFKIEQSIGKKNYKKAEEYVDELVFRSPKSQLTAYEVAKLAYINRDFDKAEAKSRELVQSNNFNPIFLDLYGHCLFANSKFKEALKCFEFVNNSVGTPKSTFMIGLCHFLLGNTNLARDFLYSAYQQDKRMFDKLVLNLHAELPSSISNKLWEQLNKILESIL